MRPPIPPPLPRVDGPPPHDGSPPPPFLIECLRAEERPGVSERFTPDARLIMTRRLKASGLLRLLGDREARSLLVLLAHVRPDGRCEATVPEVAALLGTSPAKARDRMRRLARVIWDGEPLAREVRRDSGLDGWVPSRRLVGLLPAPEPAPVVPPPLPAAGRSAVVGLSRAVYGTPREEVERWVARQLAPGGGSGVAPTDHEGDPLRARLVALGMTPALADGLLARYPRGRVERQLEWLPYRKAKRPASFLLAAVERDFGPPIVLGGRAHL